MKPEEKIKIVTQLVDKIKETRSHEDAIRELFGDCYFESPFYQSEFALESFAIETVSKLIGDEGEWVDYYVNELECGERSTVVEYSKHGSEERFKHEIKGVASLIKAVEL